MKIKINVIIIVDNKNNIPIINCFEIPEIVLMDSTILMDMDNKKIITPDMISSLGVFIFNLDICFYITSLSI